MPDAVVKALKDIAATYGSIENVDEYIRELETHGRLQFETWD